MYRFWIHKYIYVCRQVDLYMQPDTDPRSTCTRRRSTRLRASVICNIAAKIAGFVSNVFGALPSPTRHLFVYFSFSFFKHFVSFVVFLRSNTLYTLHP